MTTESSKPRGGQRRKKEERRRAGLLKVMEPLRGTTLDGFEDGIDFEALFDQFTEHMRDGLLVVGALRTVISMNPAACELLGYTGPLPASVSDVVRDVDFGFAVGDAMHDRRDLWHEAYFPNPDRLLQFHIIPIMNTSGEPVLAGVSVADVTRLRYLETVRRDFVANVSHELRTPIASINLLVETIENGAIEDRAATEHFLHRIQVETQAMGLLVEELLELSRLESGALYLELAPVDLQSLFENVVNRLTPLAGEKGVDIDIDVQSPLPPVTADEKRLEQVLMNLVHNAIKFTPTDGRVTLRAVRQGRSAEVDVIDTGVGIDAEQVSRIFERFYKVDKGRSRAQGAGLGLAIARHVLELHGSQLHVVSNVGHGARFSFALPIAG